jgi:hypothetical protein
MADTTASAKLATALQDAARRRGMTQVNIADKIRELGGDVAAQSPLWVSRRMTGRKTLLDVDPDLFLIARALEIGRWELVDIVLQAIFGNSADDDGRCRTCESPSPALHPATQSEGEVTHLCPDLFHQVNQPIDYVLTGRCPDAGIGDHDCAEHIEVPLTPTEDEFAGLPILDPRMLRNADDARTVNPGGEDNNTFAEHRRHYDRGEVSADCPYCTVAED